MPRGIPGSGKYAGKKSKRVKMPKQRVDGEELSPRPSDGPRQVVEATHLLEACQWDIGLVNRVLEEAQHLMDACGGDLGRARNVAQSIHSTATLSGAGAGPSSP